MAKYRISGVPIVDEDKKFVGILTNRDLRFIHDYSIKINEVMTHENLLRHQSEQRFKKLKASCRSIRSRNCHWWTRNS